VIYSVRETDYDSCVHLALVEGPEMTAEQASETFRALYREYEAKNKAANEAFRKTFGWYDKPLQGLTQDNYHDRWREELRKAAAWNFPEFLKDRGYRRVKHMEVSIPARDELPEVSKDSPAESSPSAPQAQSSRQTAGDSAEEDPTCPTS
jgi:hypothetical protein